jgi:ketosteroid isomerase-like protein
MGTDNKQLIRQMYEAYGRGDIDAVLKYLTDDFDWYAPGGAPFSGHRLGPQQMRQLFSEVQRWVQIDEFDADEFLADGDKVVVLGRQRATVRETSTRCATVRSRPDAPLRIRTRWHPPLANRHASARR